MMLAVLQVIGHAHVQLSVALPVAGNSLNYYRSDIIDGFSSLGSYWRLGRSELTT